MNLTRSNTHNTNLSSSAVSRWLRDELAAGVCEFHLRSKSAPFAPLHVHRHWLRPRPSRPASENLTLARHAYSGTLSPPSRLVSIHPLPPTGRSSTRLAPLTRILAAAQQSSVGARWAHEYTVHTLAHVREIVNHAYSLLKCILRQALFPSNDPTLPWAYL